VHSIAVHVSAVCYFHVPGINRRGARAWSCQWWTIVSWHVRQYTVNCILYRIYDHFGYKTLSLVLRHFLRNCFIITKNYEHKTWFHTLNKLHNRKFDMSELPWTKFISMIQGRNELFPPYYFISPRTGRHFEMQLVWKRCDPDAEIRWNLKSVEFTYYELIVDPENFFELKTCGNNL